MSTLAVTVITLACRSEADRLDRLRTEESVAQLRVYAAQRAVDRADLPVLGCGSSADPALCATQDSLYGALRDAENKLDLVQRDIRRLLD